MFAVETENLSKQFKSITAVKNLNLKIETGSVFGLLGPNGAGKTTTLRMLMGFASPTGGKAYILGEEVTTYVKDYQKKIGYLPDVPAFYNWMQAGEFLHFSGELMGMKSKKLKQRIQKLLQITGLKDVDTKIGGFSRGMKQRLGLAQALINEPEIVFMDEPTSALDPIGRKEVLELIREFSGEITVILSTHILTDVERVCDTVGILNEGKLIKQKKMTDLKREYFESVLKIEVIGDKVSNFCGELNNKDWVESIENKSGNIRLVVSDIELAQVKLPGIIGNFNLKLNNFETAETTLEDIFVKVVG